MIKYLEHCPRVEALLITMQVNALTKPRSTSPQDHSSHATASLLPQAAAATACTAVAAAVKIAAETAPGLRRSNSAPCVAPATFTAAPQQARLLHRSVAAQQQLLLGIPARTSGLSGSTTTGTATSAAPLPELGHLMKVAGTATGCMKPLLGPELTRYLPVHVVPAQKPPSAATLQLSLRAPVPYRVYEAPGSYDTSNYCGDAVVKSGFEPSYAGAF
jgi:hypothetical protein